MKKKIILVILLFGCVLSACCRYPGRLVLGSESMPCSDDNQESIGDQEGMYPGEEAEEEEAPDE